MGRIARGASISTLRPRAGTNSGVRHADFADHQHFSGPTAAVLDSRTLRSTPESGHRGGYDGPSARRASRSTRRWTLGHLLALRITPATEQDCSQVAEVARSVREATGGSVELAYVDRG